MDIQSFLVTVLQTPAVLSTVVVVLVAYFVKLYLTPDNGLSLPVAEYNSDNDYTQSLLNASMKYPDEPFILPTSPPEIVLPNSMVNEISKFKHDQMSITQWIHENMQGKYTGLGKENQDEIKDAVRQDLTRNIQATLSDLQNEVQYAVDTEIGDCDEFTEILLAYKLPRIVALLSGRIFVGLPWCRTEDWIDINVNYTLNIVDTVKAASRWSVYWRPFVVPFLPEFYKLMAMKKRARKMMEPVIEKMLCTYRSSEKKFVANDGKELPFGSGQYNLIAWQIQKYKSLGDAKVGNISEDQLIMSFAAIHTTSMTVSFALFELAAHPEYIAELRSEIESIIKEEDYPEKALRKSSMPKLKKLDSFLKESQRCNPLRITNMMRVVTAPKGVTLSTGLCLPYGSTVTIAMPAIPGMPVPKSYQSIASKQPPLTEFYPFRYSEMRSQEGSSHQHQFVTTGTDSINFGHGPGACPGRFFASNEIKVILVEIIRRYDVGLGPNGEGTALGFKKPVNITQRTDRYPDPTAKIWFRKRGFV